MDFKKTANCQNADSQLKKSKVQRQEVKIKPPAYHQIDSHKWVNKMEIFRLLAS